MTELAVAVGNAGGLPLGFWIHDPIGWLTLLNPTQKERKLALKSRNKKDIQHLQINCHQKQDILSKFIKRLMKWNSANIYN